MHGDQRPAPARHRAARLRARPRLTGLSFGLATTTNFALFTQELPPGRARQQALGYYTAGIAVGFALGAFVAGYAADWLGTPGAFVIAVAFGLVTLLGVPPRPVAGAPPPAPEPPFRLAALRHPRSDRGRRRLQSVH